MVDLHGHFLPGIDDGSESPEISAQMLKAAYAQGVDVMVATPHFYPDREETQAFLQQRKRVRELIPYEPDAMPKILLGAEVAYSDSLSRSKELHSLCIGDSSLLLLEMPFAPWTERVVENVCAIRKNLGLTPVLAHIERYFSFLPNSNVLDRLRKEGVYFQSNGEFFLAPFRRRRAMKMLHSGLIHFLGSDCHDTERRAPNLGSAVNKILCSGAIQSYQEIEQRAYSLLGLEDIAMRGLR